MVKIEVGKGAVYLLFEAEAVPERREIFSLVERALTQAGQTPWAEMEMDVFSGNGQALVVTRPGKAYCRCFFFSDLDDLLGGVMACEEGESVLYRAAGGFVLAVERSLVCPGLYEFGQRMDAGPLWECHAREQGLCLLEENAVAALHRYFTTGSNDCEIR